MSETKHTKGPWFVGTQNDSLFVIDRKPHPAPADYITPSLDVKVIASCGPSREDQANANLIGAAPELLEACKQYEAHFGDLLKLLRPAIAKAEGR